MSAPREAAEAIVAAGRRMSALGLVPATAGDFSARLTDGRVSVTVSGRHKDAAAGPGLGSRQRVRAAGGTVATDRHPAAPDFPAVPRRFGLPA